MASNNGWLVASPHRRSHGSSSVSHTSWAIKSALEIMEAANGKQIIMSLDYDGTLCPIADDPSRAVITDEMRATLQQLSERFPTAIVSGRSTEKVCNFVRLTNLYYAGSHGMDIKGPSESTVPVSGQLATQFLTMIDEIYPILLDKTKSTPGATVENNKFCLSVHFRCVDEKRWNELAHQVVSVVFKYPKLRLTTGRKVLEISPTIEWDKGKALEYLLGALGYDDSDIFPIFIGDDRTNEDGFKVLRGRKQILPSMSYEQLN